jgi:hypothetical protein
MRLVDSDERSLDARVQAALTTIGGQVAVSRFTLWYTTRPPVHLAVVLSLNPPIPAAPRHRGRSPEPIGRDPSGSPRGCAADRL